MQSIFNLMHLASISEKALHCLLRPTVVSRKDFACSFFNPLPFFFVGVLQNRFLGARREIYAAKLNVRDFGVQQSLEPRTARFRIGCALRQTCAQAFGKLINYDDDVASFIYRRHRLVITFDRFIKQHLIDCTGIQ